MRLKNLTQTFSLLICFFIPVFLSSCGGNDQKVQKPYIPRGPGGGSDDGGDNSTDNSIDVKNPGVDFSDIYEQVENKSADIVFTVSSGNVKNFQVDLDAVSKQSIDWKLTKTGTCTGNIYAPGSCTVKITFMPTQVGKYNTTLNYSYTNNQNKLVSKSIPILSNPIKSLLGASLPIALPASDLASLVSASYFADTGNYVGLAKASETTDPSLIVVNANSPLTILQKVLSYGVSSFANTIFYKNITPSPYSFSLLNLADTPYEIKNISSSIAAGNTATYGSDKNGNIFQINSNGTSIYKYNVNNYVNELITVDTSDNNIVYGIFHNYQTPSNIYLCSINIVAFSHACSSMENSSLLANATRILANKGKVFVITEQNNVLNIVGFESNMQSVITKKFQLAETISVNSAYPPVYDSLNNVLYIITNSSNNAGYMMTAVDTNDGTKSSPYYFNKTEIISAPFLSHIDNASSTQDRVLVSSGDGKDGKIYAFQKDTLKSLITIKPFTFNNGSVFYSLPAKTSFYPLAASISKGHIYIPYSSQSGQALYAFDANW